MARDIRIDIIGDSARFSKSAAEAAAELELLKHEAGDSAKNFSVFNESVTTSTGKMDPFIRSMRDARKASQDAGDAILKASRLSEQAGKVLGDIAPSANTAADQIGFFARSMSTVTGVLGTSVPLFGSLGAALIGLPALAIAATVAIVALADTIGTLVAITADLVAPLGLTLVLLGGLGAAFGYAAKQALANKKEMDGVMDAFHNLGGHIQRDFAPYIHEAIGGLVTFIQYLNKLAGMNLNDAFKSFSTTGIQMLNKFVETVAHVVARPIRLAFKVAFGRGSEAGDYVAKWWHQFTGFLFGYTRQHPIRLDGHVIQMTRQHVDGIFQPLLDWFNRHHFTKQGIEIGHGILQGFMQSGAAHKVGQFFVAALEDAFKTTLVAYLRLMQSLSNDANRPLAEIAAAIRSKIGEAWHYVASTAGHVWQSLQNAAHSAISTIEGWVHQLISLIESPLSLHISVPSISLPHIPGLPNLGIPGLSSMSSIGPAAPAMGGGISASGASNAPSVNVYVDGQQLFQVMRNRAIKQGVSTGQAVFRGVA